MVNCACHPQGWYDCGACPDPVKYTRRCRYPMETPARFPDYPREGETKCEAWGMDVHAIQVWRLAALFEKGQVRLSEMDLWTFEAIEHIGATRNRLERARIEAAKNKVQ